MKYGPHDGIMAMAIGTKAQGNHGVHAGVILNGQMPANIFQVCPISGDGIAGVSALRI